MESSSMDLDLHLDGFNTGEELSNLKVEEICIKVDNVLSCSSPNTENEMIYHGRIMDTYIKVVQPELECYISGTIKIGQDSCKDEVLIEIVSRVAKIVVHHKSFNIEGLDKMNLIFERMMGSMENELRKILDTPNLGKGEEEEDGFPYLSNDSICQMNVIARVMVMGGYETECCQVYTLLRCSSFKESMKRIGFQKLSVEEIHEMSWQQMESYISTWTKVVKHTADILFPREKKLCNQVFFDPRVGHGIMTNLARAIIILFLDFVQEATLSAMLQPEKLFKYLEIYDALACLFHDEVIPISAPASNDLKTEVLLVQKRLGDNVISIFDNLEISITNDATTNPIPNGAVHPLTRYTMNYLRYACDFKNTLENIFKSDNNVCTEEADHYAIKLVKIMESLDANIDAKSTLYKDPSLKYVFLMNNGRYMLRKLKESTEMRELVGETWRRKRSTTLRVYHKSYQRETWGKVLQCLSHEGVQFKGKVNKPLLKERIKNFNQLFEGIHKTQGAWLVSDEQLLSELRVSISTVVIPAYRSFLATFNQHLQGKERDKYIKFHPEDIEATIEKLFDGKLITSTRIRK